MDLKQYRYARTYCVNVKLNGFILIDVCVGLLSFIVIAYNQYNMIALRRYTHITETILFSIEVISGLILGGSAYILTQSLKNMTSKKTNICLLVWHIINVFVDSIFIIVGGILYWNWLKKLGKSNWNQCMSENNPSCKEAY